MKKGKCLEVCFIIIIFFSFVKPGGGTRLQFSSFSSQWKGGDIHIVFLAYVSRVFMALEAGVLRLKCQTLWDDSAKSSWHCINSAASWFSEGIKNKRIGKFSFLLKNILVWTKIVCAVIWKYRGIQSISIFYTPYYVTLKNEGRSKTRWVSTSEGWQVWEIGTPETHLPPWQCRRGGERLESWTCQQAHRLSTCLCKGGIWQCFISRGFSGNKGLSRRGMIGLHWIYSSLQLCKGTVKDIRSLTCGLFGNVDPQADGCSGKNLMPCSLPRRKHYFLLVVSREQGWFGRNRKETVETIPQWHPAQLEGTFELWPCSHLPKLPSDHFWCVFYLCVSPDHFY